MNNIQTPSYQININQTPLTALNGATQSPPEVFPTLPAAIVSVSGGGQFSLARRGAGYVIGRNRGTLDVWVTMPTAGTARTIAYLTDNLAAPTNFIMLGIDTMNRPLLEWTDELGSTVAEVTPSYPAIPAGARINVRMAWNALTAIAGEEPRFGYLWVESGRIPVPNGDWATDPTSAWAAFQPTHLVLGLGLGGAGDFSRDLLLKTQVAPSAFT
jgi:hypothetical protein